MKSARLLGALCAVLLSVAPARATEQASYVTPITGPMNMATFAGTYLNPALRALASCSWGTSAPLNGPGSAALPYQCWADTTSNPVVVKYWDGASWVVAAKLNTSTHGWTPSYQGTDLSTASIATTGTSGHTVPFLDGANSWSAAQTFSSALTYGGVTLSNAVTGTGNMVLSAAPTLTGAVAVTGAVNVNGTISAASTSASAVTAGAGGANNPAFQVDASTSSQVAGLKITGAATGGTVAVAAIDSGSNTNLTVNAKGTGTIGIGSVSTGAVTITPPTTHSGALTYGGVTLSNAVTGTGNMVLSAGPTFTGTITASVGNFSSTLASTAHTITSASASALAVGLNGATNPAFDVDASTASQAAGLKITGAATGGTVAVAAIDSGSNTNLTFNAKGTGTIGIGSVSTGAVTITPPTTHSGALTYGGVTLSNAVTGNGNMVLSVAPTLTGHPTVEGVTSTGATGTGKYVFDTSPTLSAPTISGLANLSGAAQFSIQSAPAQITSNQNNYNPSSVVCASSATLLINSDAARDVTGLAGGVTGCEMRLVNNGSFTITLKEQNASSTAANRFNTGGDIALASSGALTLLYDGTASRWRMASPSSTGGGSGTVTQVVCGAGLSGGTITTSGTCAISAPVSVANGGTGDTGTAWSSFTPTLTCGSATFTTTSARSKTLGKTTFIEMDFTIATLGSCVNAITFTLPNTAQSGGSMVGREIASSGVGADVSILASSASAIFTKASAAVFVVNEHFVTSGIYENQ